MVMIKGKNTDLFIKGFKVHVQTEDWGVDKKLLVSQVFKDGTVIKTIKVTYDKVKNIEIKTEKATALLNLHQSLIDWAYSQL